MEWAGSSGFDWETRPQKYVSPLNAASNLLPSYSSNSRKLSTTIITAQRFLNCVWQIPASRTRWETMCWLTYSGRKVCIDEGRTLQTLNYVSGVPVRHFRPISRCLRLLKSAKDPIHPGSNVWSHCLSMSKYKWVSDCTCDIKISLISEQVNCSVLSAYHLKWR